MTKITIFKKDGMVVGYQIKGHSGYAEEGSDIVCSGISVASQMALVGLKELNLPLKSEIRDGYIRVELEDSNEIAQVLLTSMEKTLEDISKNYAKFVKMEVKKDVY